MRLQAGPKYSPDKLKKLYLEAEAKAGKQLKTSEFQTYGLPDINYYKRAWKNLGGFYKELGREVPEKTYKRKNNPKRFFYPTEWNKFLGVVHNEKHRFHFEFLLHTGMRYDEARNVEIRDINLDRELILIKKPKGGQGKERTIQISTYLKNRIISFMKSQNLSKLDNLKFSSNQFMDRVVKEYAETAGFTDYEDFSCHNFRKSLENWGCALNINTMALTNHMGHEVNVAVGFYVATNLFNSEEKTLARAILDNLWNK